MPTSRNRPVKPWKHCRKGSDSSFWAVCLLALVHVSQARLARRELRIALAVPFRYCDRSGFPKLVRHGNQFQERLRNRRNRSPFHRKPIACHGIWSKADCLQLALRSVETCVLLECTASIGETATPLARASAHSWRELPVYIPVRVRRIVLRCAPGGFGNSRD
jgi:hypothetical protein